MKRLIKQTTAEKIYHILAMLFFALAGVAIPAYLDASRLGSLLTEAAEKSAEALEKAAEKAVADAIRDAEGSIEKLVERAGQVIDSFDPGSDAMIKGLTDSLQGLEDNRKQITTMLKGVNASREEIASVLQQSDAAETKLKQQLTIELQTRAQMAVDEGARQLENIFTGIVNNVNTNIEARNFEEALTDINTGLTRYRDAYTATENSLFNKGISRNDITPLLQEAQRNETRLLALRDITSTSIDFKTTKKTATSFEEKIAKHRSQLDDLTASRAACIHTLQVDGATANEIAEVTAQYQQLIDILTVEIEGDSEFLANVAQSISHIADQTEQAANVLSHEISQENLMQQLLTPLKNIWSGAAPVEQTIAQATQQAEIALEPVLTAGAKSLESSLSDAQAILKEAGFGDEAIKLMLQDMGSPAANGLITIERSAGIAKNFVTGITNFFTLAKNEADVLASSAVALDTDGRAVLAQLTQDLHTQAAQTFTAAREQFATGIPAGMTNSEVVTTLRGLQNTFDTMISDMQETAQKTLNESSISTDAKIAIQRDLAQTIDALKIAQQNFPKQMLDLMKKPPTGKVAQWKTAVTRSLTNSLFGMFSADSEKVLDRWVADTALSREALFQLVELRAAATSATDTTVKKANEQALDNLINYFEERYGAKNIRGFLDDNARNLPDAGTVGTLFAQAEAQARATELAASKGRFAQSLQSIIDTVRSALGFPKGGKGYTTSQRLLDMRFENGVYNESGRLIGTTGPLKLNSKLQYAALAV